MGLVSFLGVLFYFTCAVMVSRRNLVFMAHKLEMNIFTLTEAEINSKYWMIMCVAFVSEHIIRFRHYWQR